MTDGTRHALLHPESGMTTTIDPSADRRLPGVAAAVRDGGALVAYRHERRAVTRQPDSFTKIVRPDRTATIVENHRLLASSRGFASPRVLAVSSDGRIELEVVDGPSLHHLIRVGAPVPLEQIAVALAALHTAATDAEIPPLAADDPDRWITIVGRIHAAFAGTLREIADGLPPLDVSGTALVHSDLHDKNVMSTGRRIHLIDLDGLARGAPEVDVVNLGVHLELRELQSGGDPVTGIRRRELLLDAYRAERVLDDSIISAVERHTWFRLACLYLCRASTSSVVEGLLHRASGTDRMRHGSANSSR